MDFRLNETKGFVLLTLSSTVAQFHTCQLFCFCVKELISSLSTREGVMPGPQSPSITMIMSH